MSATITVDKVHEDDGGFTFAAAIEKAGDRSSHSVTLSKKDYERLGGSASSPEDFVRTCLELLVEQTAQDELLDRMDLREMISYYPKFEEEVRRRFGAPGATT